MNKKKIPLFILIPVIFLVIWGGQKIFFSKPGYYTGTLEVTEHNVGARVAGRIMDLQVEEGSQVKAGDLIATLDRYHQARKDYERATALFQQGGVSEQALEQAQLAFEDQQVISPVNGIVLVKVKEKGEVASAGSPVVVIGDMSQKWVRIFIPEGQISRVKLGQGAKVRFDGLGKSFEGRVIFIATQAEFTPRNVQTPEERVTQTFAVKVEVLNPPDNLRPGVAADITLKAD